MLAKFPGFFEGRFPIDKNRYYKIVRFVREVLKRSSKIRIHNEHTLRALTMRLLHRFKLEYMISFICTNNTRKYCKVFYPLFPIFQSQALAKGIGTGEEAFGLVEQTAEADRDQSQDAAEDSTGGGGAQPEVAEAVILDSFL